MTTTTGRRCTATRHAPTPAAYNHWGCRCPDTITAHAHYRKYLRCTPTPKRRPHLHQPDGTRHRIQALYAIGHTCDTIAPHTGGLAPPQIRSIPKRPHRRITTRTLQGIATAYNALSNTPGPSLHNTALARRRHWPTPHEWDTWGPGHIDQPDDPTPVIDPLAIQKVINRELSLDNLTPPEQAALYHQLHPHLTDGQIRHRLGLSAAQIRRAARHAERHPPT